MKTIDFKRINKDVNGNPRYVCHYSEFTTDKDRENFPYKQQIFKVNDYLDNLYKIALNRAKTLGGRKFHNKQYGGGIVFQSYNIIYLQNSIFELMKKYE